MPEKFSISTRQNTDNTDETYVGKKDAEEIYRIRMRVKNFADILSENEGLKRQEIR